jgi:hypothetical protein
LIFLFPKKADRLFGTDFLGEAGAEINFDSGKLSLVDNNEAPYMCGILSKNHSALTVFPKDKLESDNPSIREGRKRALVGIVWTNLL